MDANIVAQGATGIMNLVNNPISLIVGIVFIIITILILIFFGQFIVNGIIGLVAFIILALIGIKLPFVVTLIVSTIFGLGGLGVMLILKFFGIV